MSNAREKRLNQRPFSYVEQGRNPDIFTRAFIERAAGENQYTNGKIQAVSVSTFRLTPPIEVQCRLDVVLLIHHHF